jgi:hypothetical protein
MGTCQFHACSIMPWFHGRAHEGFSWLLMRSHASPRGQPIQGIIGNDIMDQSSSIWSLERDHQIVRVATQGCRFL